MQTTIVRQFAIACLTGVALVGTAHAQASDDAIRRLEARIDALAQENAALRQRLTRVEAAPRVARQKPEHGQGTVAARPTSALSAQQISAAREAYAADMPTKYAAPTPVVPAYN